MANVRFSKEIILDQALEIAMHQGFSAISVRNVAKAVGCSTAPIYTAFENVDALIKLTKDRVLELLLEYIDGKYTKNKFLNVGVGTLMFAKTYPRLYKELYIDSFDSVHENKIRERTLEMMKYSMSSQIMDLNQMETVLTKMWLITHGIATKLCSGAISVSSDEDLIKMLDEVGGEIITATIIKSGKFKGELSSLVREGNKDENTNFGWDIWN